ncbi:MAG TPA: polymer-forming cytoskeletal protein [Candidatus Polarisedimenticolia bacterium]|nr:polymer-forming cytoskeletal protein [Candidatus Polarisedimenticolia bacterium]
MAWGWFDHKRKESSEWTGFLERGVKLEGTVESSGTFRIDSAMKGTLVSKDTLVLGEHATIEGRIIGNRVVIAGRFDGTIEAKSRVEIQPNAIVTGDIRTPCLVIEPGAVFDGHCHMPTPTQTSQPIAIPIRSTAGQTSR